eukprot:TRINITY_DN5117_c0_g2_i1.p1 TRINITY_DN5117_c0_g2~~TRINITY_DN5117_c0_g2_i1.p1  ORF type:complete len:783 (-),score=118.89 TRINITY_DN5117_c0_g2_i1:392-2740(-)
MVTTVKDSNSTETQFSEKQSVILGGKNSQQQGFGGKLSNSQPQRYSPKTRHSLGQGQGSLPSQGQGQGYQNTHLSYQRQGPKPLYQQQHNAAGRGNFPSAQQRKQDVQFQQQQQQDLFPQISVQEESKNVAQDKQQPQFQQYPQQLHNAVGYVDQQGQSQDLAGGVQYEGQHGFGQEHGGPPFYPTVVNGMGHAQVQNGVEQRPQQVFQNVGGQQGSGGGEYIVPDSWEAADQVAQQIDRMQIQPPVAAPVYYGNNQMVPKVENGEVEQVDFPDEFMKRQQALEAKLENIDQEIVRALRDPKNTKTVLNYENQVIDFVNNKVLPYMEFEENANTYLKLLAHRIAQRFGLHTTTQKLGDKRGFVKAERTPETCLPQYLLVDVFNELQVVNNTLETEQTNGFNNSVEHFPRQQQQQQQQIRQQPQYAILQRRNYSDPVTPSGRSYMMQATQQQQAPQQPGGRGTGLWDGKSAAARAQMYDQAKERIFGESGGEDAEQQSQSVMGSGQQQQNGMYNQQGRGMKAILKNAVEERLDPDYQRGGARYRNKQFDMGKMQAEYYGNPVMTFDQHFPPLVAPDTLAHRSPSWPMTAQEAQLQHTPALSNQIPTPPQLVPHPGYYYQQWPQQFPPPMAQQSYVPVSVPGGPTYVQQMPQFPVAARPSMYVTAPVQGSPALHPQMMEVAVAAPPLPNGYVAIPPPTQQTLPTFAPPANQPYPWNGVHPNVAQGNVQGVLALNPQDMQSGQFLSHKQKVFRKNPKSQLPKEIDGSADHKIVVPPLGEEGTAGF